MAKYENRYKVVCGGEEAISELVEDLMAKGWKTVGGVFVVSEGSVDGQELYYQAMRLNVLNT